MFIWKFEMYLGIFAKSLKYHKLAIRIIYDIHIKCRHQCLCIHSQGNLELLKWILILRGIVQIHRKGRPHNEVNTQPPRCLFYKSCHLPGT